MNIYKRQMDELGLNIDQYSNMVDIPKSIVNKMVNGNGEVVENNMEINNFLRKNLFGKHQEIENNKEEKKVEALNVKLSRGENSYESKKKYLLEKYPNSKEVLWYVYEYDKDIYFNKYNVANRADLMRRYTFNCNVGRLKGHKGVGITTIERLTEKKYDELGTKSAYPLICQLYDCFENNGLRKRNKKAETIIYGGNSEKGKKGFQKVNYTEEEQKLRDWFYNFDFKEFSNKYNITTTQLAKDLKISGSTIKAIKKGIYRPSMTLVNKLYNYVDSYENKVETETITTEQTQVFDIPVNKEHLKELEDNYNNFITTIDEKSDIEILPNEEILKNLLKDRLTQEEKTLIILFGGRI